MLRILIIDDHTLFRELLVPALEEIESNAIIYQASSIEEGKNLLKYYKKVDLIFLDLSYPNEHSWRNFPFNKASIKNTPIIILSASTDIDDVKMALKKGCKGYITKSSNKQQLLICTKTILNGGNYISADMLSQLENSNTTHLQHATKPTQLDQLSARQHQILNLLTKGHSNKNIATLCKISEGTVKLHVSTILKILGVSNRTQAVIKVNELKLS